MATGSSTRLTLLNRLKKDPHDPVSQRTFCDIYQPLIRKYLSYRGFQEADREEVSQEVIIKVLGLLSRFKYKKKVKKTGDKGKTGSFRMPEWGPNSSFPDASRVTKGRAAPAGR